RESLLEIRGEEPAAGADHHGPAERAVDASGRLIDLERVRETELEALVAAGDPPPEQPMLHERAHPDGGPGRAAIRLGGPIAHEPADLVEAVQKTLCRFVDRHARDHSFDPRSRPSSVKLPAILPRSAGSRLSASAPSGLALAPLVPRRP